MPAEEQRPLTQANTELHQMAQQRGLSIGQLLLGRYLVRRVIGRGAMGEVLEVREQQSGIDYALKRVPPELARDTGHLASIRANFALASQLTYPHIGTVRSLEIDPTSGETYVVMDLVRGSDLASWLVQKRLELGHVAAPLPMPLVLGLAEQIAAALDYAHSQPISRGPDGKAKLYGVLHRDLKPANVMLDATREYRPGVPYVKLVDFGLAAEIQASLQSMSIVGNNRIVGTPLYMAPEQWEGRTLTRGVDQWALGVMLYEMAAGRRPFDGPTETAIRENIRRADPEEPGALSAAQWTALKRAFNPDRRKRYASCLALVHALASADPLTRGSIQASPLPMPPEEVGTGSRGPSATSPATQRSWRPAVAVLCVSAAAAGAWFGFQHWQRGVIHEEIAGAVANAEQARRTFGDSLETAIASLQTLQQKYAATYPEQLAPLATTLEQLRSRRSQLQERASAFDAALTRAEALIATDAPAALRKFDEAQRLGQADVTAEFPDLLSTLSPALESRRQKALEATRAAEKRATEERETRLRQEFAKEYAKATTAAQGMEWPLVKACLEGALPALGALDHPDKIAATGLLRRAEAEIDLRGRFEAKLKSAEELLASDPELAKKVFGEAKVIWPAAPDFTRVDKGIASAEAALSHKRYNTAMQQAQKALADKRWPEAQAAFGQALTERPGDEAASTGLSEAKYQAAVARAEKLLNDRLWTEAEADAALAQALAQRNNDQAARSIISRAKAGALEERYAAALERGRKAYIDKDWPTAEAAFAAALREKPTDAEAQRLLDQTRKEASDARFAAALSAAKTAIEKQHWPSAKEALQQAEKERAADAELGKLKLLVAQASQPKAPVAPPPPQPAFGAEKVYGPFSVYANRIQGVPLDKNGEVVPVRGDLDNEQYEEALKARRTSLKINAGAKVRIEASGKWYSGPGGAWVTADGRYDDGREALKNFRAFKGPNEGYNIAMLVAYVCEKEKPVTLDYVEIAREGRVWAFEGKPIEFVMPVAGTLRLQQNRDGFFDVTQGALTVKITVQEKLK